MSNEPEVKIENFAPDCDMIKIMIGDVSVLIERTSLNGEVFISVLCDDFEHRMVLGEESETTIL